MHIEAPESGSAVCANDFPLGVGRTSTKIRGVGILCDCAACTWAVVAVSGLGTGEEEHDVGAEAEPFLNLCLFSCWFCCFPLGRHMGAMWPGLPHAWNVKFFRVQSLVLWFEFPKCKYFPFKSLHVVVPWHDASFFLCFALWTLATTGAFKKPFDWCTADLWSDVTISICGIVKSAICNILKWRSCILVM